MLLQGREFKSLIITMEPSGCRISRSAMDPTQVDSVFWRKPTGRHAARNSLTTTLERRRPTPRRPAPAYAALGSIARGTRCAVTLERNMKNAGGSCLVVRRHARLCTAYRRKRVSAWRRGSRAGWVTAGLCHATCVGNRRRARATGPLHGVEAPHRPLAALRC